MFSSGHCGCRAGPVKSARAKKLACGRFPPDLTSTLLAPSRSEIDRGGLMSDRSRDAKSWREIEGALRRSQTIAAAGQYAAAIMHEINNPLETICNLSYLLQVEADNPARVRQYSCQIGEQLETVIPHCAPHAELLPISGHSGSNRFGGPGGGRAPCSPAKARRETGESPQGHTVGRDGCRTRRRVATGPIQPSLECDRRIADQWRTGHSSSQEPRRSPPDGR